MSKPFEKYGTVETERAQAILELTKHLTAYQLEAILEEYTKLREALKDIRSEWARGLP